MLERAFSKNEYLSAFNLAKQRRLFTKVFDDNAQVTNALIFHQVIAMTCKHRLYIRHLSGKIR